MLKNRKLFPIMLSIPSLLILITSVYGIEKQKLVFSTQNYLKELNLDTGVLRTLTTQNEKVYSIAYDYKERYIYVPRYKTGDIVRFPYPTNHTVTLETIAKATYPLGIVFDSVNNHLYWTETLSSGKIMRCNPDGTDVTILLNDVSPAALTLDIHNRWIYYGQQVSPSKILRINFDGTDKRIIVQNLRTYVFGIELDVDVNRIYWMEYQTGDLRSAYFNGFNVRTIVNTNAISQNWDIDMDGDFIFYTSNNNIMKINKSLEQTPTVVHTDTHQIYGLLFNKQDASQRPRCCMVHDRCYNQNSRDGCSGIHLDEYSYEWTSLSIRCTNRPGSCDYKNYYCDKEFLECLSNASFPRTCLPGLRNFYKRV